MPSSDPFRRWSAKGTCPGCTGLHVCDGADPTCPGCISGEHGRDRRHQQMTHPACDAECGQLVRDGFAGMEVVVSPLRPLVPTGYEDLAMTCPHGVTWHTEPTSDQQAKWAREGVSDDRLGR